MATELTDFVNDWNCYQELFETNVLYHLLWIFIDYFKVVIHWIYLSENCSHCVIPVLKCLTDIVLVLHIWQRIMKICYFISVHDFWHCVFWCFVVSQLEVYLVVFGNEIFQQVFPVLRKDIHLVHAWSLFAFSLQTGRLWLLLIVFPNVFLILSELLNVSFLLFLAKSCLVTVALNFLNDISAGLHLIV